MRKLILFASLVLAVHLSYSQIKPTNALQDSNLFKPRIKGHVIQILKWIDKLGVNHLVLTETYEFISSATISTWGQDYREEECADKELYAYHFLGTDSLLWKLLDFQRACSVDNIVEFRRRATTVTDLDSDGIAETWIMYSLICTSDVSPRTLKLIMHEGSRKYAIRGTSQPAKKMLDEEFGGKYNPDYAFSTLALPLKNFAKTLWNNNLYDLE